MQQLADPSEHLIAVSLLNALARTHNPQLLPQPLIRLLVREAGPHSYSSDADMALHENVKRAVALGLSASPDLSHLPPEWIQLLGQLAADRSAHINVSVAGGLASHPNLATLPSQVGRLLPTLIAASHRAREMFAKRLKANPNRGQLNPQFLPDDMQYLLE